jgi:hypothetical protein
VHNELGIFYTCTQHCLPGRVMLTNTLQMKHLLYLFLLTLPVLLLAQEANPPAEGFNAAQSDTKAIEIADEVMQQMGGRAAWDNTRYLRWTFFGRRTLLWDKWTGNVRIDFADNNDVYLVNINDDSGKVWKDGAYLSQPDSLAKYLGQAKSIWINDSYWLVMPFKLKDSGLTLKYLGEDSKGDTLRHKLQLTFEAVGDTPDNKYWVFVDDDTKLVSEWSFFTRFDDKEPRFSTPWADYRPYGNILLSGNRGRGQLTNIAAYNSVPGSVFEDAKAYNPAIWE